MKITNNANLPSAIVKAVLARDGAYEKLGDYSVTALMNPPRQTQLLARLDEYLEEDVSDKIYALDGSSMHNILEAAKADGDIVERRMVLGFDIEGVGVRKISGMFDLLRTDNILVDYKKASVWEYVYGLKEDRIAQLNTYRWMIAKMDGHDKAPEKIQVVMIFRDWSKPEAGRRKLRGDTAYPQQQVMQLTVPIWSDQKVEAFLAERIRLHEAARAADTDALPLCSDEDRWAKEPKFAVMKEGNKKAVKLFDDEPAALAYIKTILPGKGKHSIEVRGGEYARCLNYCAAAEFCTQNGGTLPAPKEKVA